MPFFRFVILSISCYFSYLSPYFELKNWSEIESCINAWLINILDKNMNYYLQTVLDLLCSCRIKEIHCEEGFLESDGFKGYTLYRVRTSVLFRKFIFSSCLRLLLPWEAAIFYFAWTQRSKLYFYIYQSLRARHYPFSPARSTESQCLISRLTQFDGPICNFLFWTFSWANRSAFCGKWLNFGGICLKDTRKSLNWVNMSRCSNYSLLKD